MTAKAFEAYLNSKNCSVSGKKTLTAVRNDDPGKSATYPVSGKDVADSDVSRVCTALGVGVPAL